MKMPRTILIAVVAFALVALTLIATVGAEGQPPPAASVATGAHQSQGDTGDAGAAVAAADEAADLEAARAAIEEFDAAALGCLSEGDGATDCVWDAVDALLWDLDDALYDGFDDFDDCGYYDELGEFDEFDEFDGFDEFDEFDEFDVYRQVSGFDECGDFGDFDVGSGDPEVILVRYDVSSGILGAAELPAVAAGLTDLQNDRATHEAIWERFTQLIPAEARQMLTTFEIFTDGLDGNVAAVSVNESDVTTWLLAVDPVDSHDLAELNHTLIHEFAHLLTLNNTQVPALPWDISEFAYDRAGGACRTYFPGEGCSLPESYINAFVTNYWLDLLAEFNAIEENSGSDEEYWDAVDEFGRTYRDQFDTDYAMSGPAEDIAESFVIFVLHERPTGASIAEQKVRFFYDYPELVELRAEIRAQL